MMIEITDVIEYADVRVGKLTITIADKSKQYRALWYAHLSGPVNGQNTLPAGIFPLRYKLYQGIVNCPWVSFNKVFKAPIYPMGNLSYDELMPFIYIQHPDGTEVTLTEWRQVTDTMALYVTKFRMTTPTVDVSPKEFLNKKKLFDLENW